MEEYGNYDVDADSGYAEGENWTSSDNWGFAAYPNLEQEQAMPWEHYHAYGEEESIHDHDHDQDHLEDINDIARNSSLSADAAEFVPKSLSNSLVTYQPPTTVSNYGPRYSIQNLQIARRSQNIQQTMIQCHRHHHHQHYMPQSLHIHQHYGCSDPSHRVADAHGRCHGVVHPGAVAGAPAHGTCIMAHGAHTGHVPHAAYLPHGAHVPHAAAAAVAATHQALHASQLYGTTQEYLHHPHQLQLGENPAQEQLSITDKHLSATTLSTTARKVPCVVPSCTYVCKSTYH